VAQQGYRTLEVEKIVATAQLLRNRIRERFAERNLSDVAGQLVEFAREAEANILWYHRAHVPMRLMIGLVLLILPSLVWYGVSIGHFTPVEIHLHEFLQTCEAVLASVVFVGAAILFLVSAENRLKRNRVIQHLDALRGLAHIVDMHQLAKDPDRLLGNTTPDQWTESSPVVEMTEFELGRYYDYCSEMMSLISKVAALYAQASVDPTIGSSVLEVEQLTTGLSRKIWQKIMLLRRIYAGNHEARGDRTPGEPAPAPKSDDGLLA
jgi:hypothetical protein